MRAPGSYDERVLPARINGEKKREECAPADEMVQGMFPGAANGAHHLMAMLSGRFDGTTGSHERGRGDVGVRIDPRRTGDGAGRLHLYVDVGQTVLHGLECPDGDPE